MAQIQKVIITDYPDGSRVMSNIRNKKGIPFFKENDTYTATRVVTWFDGSPMDDSKVDGKIYLKHRQSGDYYLVNLPNWGETFLQKPNVASLRNMPSTEILLLRMGYYKGVTLLGYYAENGGDTPAPIEYYLSDTTESDDGGSVFEVGGIKLEHNFEGDVNVKYYGVRENTPEDTSQINLVLTKHKDVVIPEGDFIIDTVSLDTDGKRGIILNSGNSLKLTPNTNLIAITASEGRYSVIDVVNIQDVQILGGNIVGDRDSHIGTAGEWGHGINIWSSKNVKINNVNISNCWGDGIYIGGYDGTSLYGGTIITSESLAVPAENVNIDNVSIYNCRRQGISMVCGKNITVLNSTLDFTNGAMPQALIDIEPNRRLNERYGYVENVLIDNCTFKNGATQGVVFYNLDTEAYAIRNVKIFKSNFLDNSSSHLGVRRASDVTVENCSFNNSLDAGSGGQVSLSGKNIIFRNNTVRKSSDGTYGIRCYAENLSINILIDNNIIELPNGHPFRVEGDLISDLTISNNTVNGVSTNVLSGQSNTDYPNIKFYKNIFNNTTGTVGFFQNATGVSYTNMKIIGNYFTGNNGIINIRPNYESIDILDNTFSNASITLLGLSGGKNTLISGNTFRNNNSSRIIYGTMDASFIVKKNIFIDNVTIEEDVYVGSNNRSIVVEDNIFINSSGTGNKALNILGTISRGRAINNNTVMGYVTVSTIVESLPQHGNVEDGLDLSVATNNRLGVVKRSGIVTEITNSDAEEAEPAVITDFDEATQAHNDLVDKINSLVLLANRCKQAINSKLHADITSGQQAPQA